MGSSLGGGEHFVSGAVPPRQSSVGVSGGVSADPAVGDVSGGVSTSPTVRYNAPQPGRLSVGVSTVRRLAYAGAAMTPALAQRCVAVFNPELFVNHYGSTEVYTYSIHSDQAAAPGCAGRSAVNARLRLVRTAPGAAPDDEVARGEVGEIICHLSSPEAFTGYHNRADADAKSIRDSWFFTGDLGYQDADGNLWVVGRIDDMIISGGENIHPLEVEDVLCDAPGVLEAAVVGLPDDRLGQSVTAFVVLEDLPPDADACSVAARRLESHCLASGALARFKRPRSYRFVASLPKSPSGKILRRKLRESFVGAAI